MNESRKCETGFYLSTSHVKTNVFLLDPGYCPVKLGMMGVRLQSGINTLQGFKEDKRNMVTPGNTNALGKYRLHEIVSCHYETLKFD